MIRAPYILIVAHEGLDACNGMPDAGDAACEKSVSLRGGQFVEEFLPEVYRGSGSRKVLGEGPIAQEAE